MSIVNLSTTKTSLPLNFFTRPYVKGMERLRITFFQNDENRRPASLKGRVSLVFVKFSLSIPLINYLALGILNLSVRKKTVELNPIDSSRERDLPPVSNQANDKIAIKYQSGEMQIVSAYKLINFFGDEEIIGIHKTIDQIEMGAHKICAKRTKHGWVIQQQAIRGCTAGASAMLALDHQQQLDGSLLITRNLGTREDIQNDLASVSLKSILRLLRGDSQPTETLKKWIAEKGSAIVQIGGEIGGHVIIVDAIDDDGVDIRDPYHGWAIRINKDAFKKRFEREYLDYAIQVDSK